MRWFMAGLLAAGCVMLAATPASAARPARGCPDHFSPYTQEEIRAMFPKASVDKINSYDKNGDDIICGKGTPSTFFIVVDNTANRP
jgi:hypothetical protein